MDTKLIPIIVVAKTIIVGTIQEFGLPVNGNPNMPAIVMNFNKEDADLIVKKVLQPNANPEHFHVSVFQKGGRKNIAVYAVLDLSELHIIPSGNMMIIGQLPKHTSKYRYLIGAETYDVKEKSIDEFLSRKEQYGSYYVTCGYHHPTVWSGVSVSVNEWRIELSKIHGGGMLERMFRSIYRDI